MQLDNTDEQITTDDSLFFTPKKKVMRARKWREIEDLKSQQQLSRELKDIDQSFVFALSDLV